MIITHNSQILKKSAAHICNQYWNTLYSLELPNSITDK